MDESGASTAPTNRAARAAISVSTDPDRSGGCEERRLKIAMRLRMQVRMPPRPISTHLPNPNQRRAGAPPHLRTERRQASPSSAAADLGLVRVFRVSPV